MRVNFVQNPMVWITIRQNFGKIIKFYTEKQKEEKKSGLLCCGSGHYQFSKNHTDADPDPNYRPNPTYN